MNAPLLCLLTATTTAALAGELRVPAHTAYLDPDVNGARVSERAGITGWRNPDLKVLWFGDLKQSGELTAALELRLPAGREGRFRLTAAGTAREAAATGQSNATVRVNFGAFPIPAAGYQRFTLESLNPAGEPAGDLQALLLDGPAATGAHFNLKERRNAASVHLTYPTPPGTNLEAFYCEVTAVEDPLWTFYMACGWHRGYFGMQVNSPTERRIIFSVWDSGDEAVDRGKVADENRVRLMGKGEGVYAGDFGNEGTGGHSHLKYLWKTGEKQRFYVTAQPVDATHTIFSGYYFHPDKQAWVLISSWKAPKDGGWLKRPHSFSENFVGANGHLRRKARFGNQWMRTPEGQWIELTTATFSHDVTGRADRFDRFMGVEDGQFFLSHGGFVAGRSEPRERHERPALGHPPADIPARRELSSLR